MDKPRDCHSYMESEKKKKKEVQMTVFTKKE